jgi:hypothetical protein
MWHDSGIGKVNDRALYLGGVGPHRSNVLPAREKYFGKSKAYLISLFRWNLTVSKKSDCSDLIVSSNSYTNLTSCGDSSSCIEDSNANHWGQKIY